MKRSILASILVGWIHGMEQKVISDFFVSFCKK